MLIKVLNGGQGRGGCSHLIRKNEAYYILQELNRLTSMCSLCIKNLFGSHPKISKVLEARCVPYWPDKMHEIPEWNKTKEDK